MKPHRLAVVILVLCHIQLFAQTKLSGILIDSETNSPVEYATIYIDGTTHGTISDKTGFFKFDNIKFPCRIVVLTSSPKFQQFYKQHNMNIM